MFTEGMNGFLGPTTNVAGAVERAQTGSPLQLVGTALLCKAFALQASVLPREQ